MIDPNKCPAVGDKCKACIGIAQTAMAAVLEGSRSEGAQDFSQQDIDVEIEVSSLDIKTLVERPHVSQALSCRDRQNDAREIGYEFATKIIREQQ